MKSNTEIEKIVTSKTRKIGEWIVAPAYKTRMNKKTLGLERHRQGGRVWWHNWGVWFGERSGAAFMEFASFRSAMQYAKGRAK